MATALIGLGSNLGDRAAALENAVALLTAEPRIRVEAVSNFRQSKPAGGPEGQGEFLNSAARLETSLSPEELLARLLAIEDQIGRVREERWGPRVIDLDLLLYDRVELKTPTLELPHPRMCYRRFVLEPAAEIAGEMVWPVNGWSVARLLNHLNATPNYIALAGPTFGLRKRLALALKDDARFSVLVSSHDDRAVAFMGARLNWDGAREFIAERADALHDALAQCQAKWLLTDFWFGQVPAVIQWMRDVVKSEPSMDQRFLSDWNSLRESLPNPKLLVFCERTLQTVEDSFCSTLAEYVSTTSLGPRIRLRFDVGNASSVRDEVLAAMQAME